MSAVVQTKLLGLGLEEGGEGSILIFIHANPYHCPGESILLKLKFQKTLDGYKITPQNDKHLQLLQTFYNKEILQQTACVCLPGNKFMIIPDEHYVMTSSKDWEKKRISSCIFDGALKVTVQVPDSHAPKTTPLTCLVGDKVYVLSSRYIPPFVLYEPSFEAFDTLKNSWEIFEEPLFNANDHVYFKELCATGCAVFENYILVCFSNIKDMLDVPIYSFNTVSKKWKRVSVPDYNDKLPVRPDSDDLVDSMDDYWYELGRLRNEAEAECRIWYGEAVVIGHVLYTYNPFYEKLVSYSLTKAPGVEKDYDFSISKPTIMEGWEPVPFPMDEYNLDRTVVGAIGKIDDNSLYVIHTSQEGVMSGDTEPIHFSIVSIDKDDRRRCTVIGSFDLDFPKGDNLIYERIQYFGSRACSTA